MSNLYQDAILDAKALRASAIANAKAALEEAFEPKIQEMLRAKLSEEEVQEIEEAEEIEEVKHKEEDIKEEVAVEESTEINEQELDEILAQLEELDRVEEAKVEETETISEEKKEMEEAKDAEADHMEEAKEEEEGGEEEEAEEGEEEEAEAPEAGEKPLDDKTKVINITLGDLKRVMMAAQQELVGAQAGLDMSDEETIEEPTADSDAEAEISLDEILDELEAEGLDKTEQHPTHVIANPGEQLEEEGLEEKKEKYEEAKKVEKELKEAKATIEAMRKDLQEVNLLNAKYLYMNKLFKSKSLTESQKVKVINALDRAASVAEVKNAYETLRESFETKKQTIKESVGFASKPAGVAPKANIVEADQFISRWQKLAGIK